MVEAQQLVLAAWALAAVTLLGIGLLERRVFGSPVHEARDLWSVFWTGWALLLGLLQVWHLFLPVDDRARVAFVGLGGAGCVAGAMPLWRALRTKPGSSCRGVPSLLLGFVAVAVVAYWLSLLSLGGPRFGDTGMYLVPTVHWYESYAAVPGLANLFVPLGHNLSYFLYAALLDGGPLAHRFYHVVNSVLVMALLARGLMACARLLRRGSSGVAGDLFHALALVPTVDLAAGLFLTSPSPDTAVYLFGLVLSGELVEFLASTEPSRAGLLRLALLSAVGMTLKLSIAGLSLATGALALGWWLWRRRPSPGEAMRTTTLAVVVASFPLVTWMLRNVISSGYPLYPASMLPLPVDWIARVDATAWIQKPMAMAPLSTIFTDTAWWKTRLDSLGWMGADVLRPLTMMAVGFALFVVFRGGAWIAVLETRLSRNGGPDSQIGKTRVPPPPAVLLLAPLVAFWFCFVNTPMPRYQGATLWIFGIDLFVLALATSVDAGGRLLRATAVVLVLAAAAQPFVLGAERWPGHKDFEPVSGPRVHTELLASGMEVNVPENQVCWYAPLPCTPEPHPGLRLREPGNLGAGFAIDLILPAAADPSTD